MSRALTAHVGTWKATFMTPRVLNVAFQTTACAVSARLM